MSSVLSIAASGLLAQSKRLAVSADNVANIRSLGLKADRSNAAAGAYEPKQTALTSIPGGGVRATAVPVVPPSYDSYEPNDPDADANGLVPRPNVSLESEIVTQIQAVRAYQANLQTIKAEDRMLGELLDTFS
ncbi:MAG: flagellar basal body rod protein FlgC [Alphaproteobacteria bacterium]